MNSKRLELQERHSELEEKNFISDLFDRAILGLENSNYKVVYSTEICIEILMEDNEYDRESAEEDFYFNYAFAFWDGCPLYIWTLN